MFLIEFTLYGFLKFISCNIFGIPMQKTQKIQNCLHCFHVAQGFLNALDTSIRFMSKLI